jgi:hypothetical protein
MKFAALLPLPKNIDRGLYEVIRALQLGQKASSLSINAIFRGEDEGGGPLIDLSDFFKLGGRPQDQHGHGSTRSGGHLTLSSTIAETKGFVYLGTNQGVAFDETNERVGIQITTPEAVLHVEGPITAGAIVPSTPIYLGLSGPGNDMFNSVYGAAINPEAPTGTDLLWYQQINTEDNSDWIFGTGADGGRSRWTLTDTIDSSINQWTIRFSALYDPVGDAPPAASHLLQFGLTDSSGDIQYYNYTVTTSTLGSSFEIHTVDLDFSPPFGSGDPYPNSLQINVITGGAGLPAGTSIQIAWVEIYPTATGLTTSTPLTLVRPNNSPSGSLAVSLWQSTAAKTLVQINSDGKMILGHTVTGPAVTKLVLQQTGSQTAHLLSVLLSTGSEPSFIDSVGSWTMPQITLSTGATSGYWLRSSNGAGLAAWTAPAALTKVDDTNVTLTLGGSPTTALLNATSLTLGWTGQLAISRGGTGQSTALAAFNALSPLTTLGDLLSHNGTDNVRVAGQITTTRKLLVQTGTGSVSALPTWDTLVTGDLPTGTVTVVGSVTLANQGADIGTTNIVTSPAVGNYEIEIVLLCTTADAGAGTLTVTIGWTDPVGATTDTSVTLPLTTTGRARGIFPIRVSSGNITYSVTGGGTYGTAQYNFYARVTNRG